MSKYWVYSIGAHLLLIGSIGVLSFVGNQTKSNQPTLVEFEVVEVNTPQELPPPVVVEPVIKEVQTKRQPTPTPSEKPVERVFGLQKDALTGDADSAAVTVKKGNTLTKEVDDKTLEDDRPLPSPKPEYLVSKMPLLIKSVISEIPSQAKKQGLFQATVVLSVYIDDQGKVRRATVLKDPGYGMADLAKQAMMGFLFEPAVIDSQPVPTEIRYEYVFQVQ